MNNMTITLLEAEEAEVLTKIANKINGLDKDTFVDVKGNKDNLSEIPETLLDEFKACVLNKDNLKVWDKTYEDIQRTDFNSNEQTDLYMVEITNPTIGLTRKKIQPIDGPVYKEENDDGKKQNPPYTYLKYNDEDNTLSVSLNKINATIFKDQKSAEDAAKQINRFMKCNSVKAVKVNPDSIRTGSGSKPQLGAEYYSKLLIKAYYTVLTTEGTINIEDTKSWEKKSKLASDRTILENTYRETGRTSQPFSTNFYVGLCQLINTKFKDSDETVSYIDNICELVEKEYFESKRLFENTWEHSMILGQNTYNAFHDVDKLDDWGKTIATYYEITDRKVRFRNHHLTKAWAAITKVTLKTGSVKELKPLAFDVMFESDDPTNSIYTILINITNSTDEEEIKEFNLQLESAITKANHKDTLKAFENQQYKSIEDIDKYLDLIETSTNEDSEEEDKDYDDTKLSFQVSLQDLKSQQVHPAQPSFKENTDGKQITITLKERVERDTRIILQLPKRFGDVNILRTPMLQTPLINPTANYLTITTEGEVKSDDFEEGKVINSFQIIIHLEDPTDVKLGEDGNITFEVKADKLVNTEEQNKKEKDEHKKQENSLLAQILKILSGGGSKNSKTITQLVNQILKDQDVSKKDIQTLKNDVHTIADDTSKYMPRLKTLAPQGAVAKDIRSIVSKLDNVIDSVGTETKSKGKPVTITWKGKNYTCYPYSEGNVKNSKASHPKGSHYKSFITDDGKFIFRQYDDDSITRLNHKVNGGKQPKKEKEEESYKVDYERLSSRLDERYKK